MSDLSNLLGAVYGEIDPDGPPVHVEPSASERASAWREPMPTFESVAGAINDDDIAAALSAALIDSAPAPRFDAPAPVVSLVDTPPAAAPVIQPAPVAPQPYRTPAPAPTSAAPTWSTGQTVPAPVMAAAPPRMWVFGDDDIFPGAGAAKRGKARRR